MPLKQPYGIFYGMRHSGQRDMLQSDPIGLM